MKIRTKIQLAFGITVVAMLSVVGMIASTLNYNLMLKTVNSDIATTAAMAADDISKQLMAYENTVKIAGMDAEILNASTSEEKIAALDKYVETYKFTSGNILDTTGKSIKDGTDFSDRDYFKKALNGETSISDVTLSKYTNKYGVSIAAPICSEDEAVQGVVYFRLDNDFLNSILQNISSNNDGMLAYIMDKNGRMLVHQDESLIMNDEAMKLVDDSEEVISKLTSSDSGNCDYSISGEKYISGYQTIEGTDGWIIVVSSPESRFSDSIQNITNNLIVIDIIAVIIAIFVSIIIAGYVSKGVNRVKKSLVAISEGDFSVKVKKSKSKDEIGVLQNATASLVETLSKIIGEANLVLKGISEYNLTLSDMGVYPGEFDSLSGSINSIKEILNRLIREIQESAANVESGSRQLSAAVGIVSEGTVTQAGSIQNLVHSMDEVVERISSSSENDAVVNKKLRELDDEIKHSNTQMSELLGIVHQIEEMSEDIKKIVGTIDSIAFQTNILALNASVEAARAGDNGKGFAVVAEEVGTLAAKCGESSKKTAELIEKTIVAISNAKEYADSTFEAINGIVSNSEEISQAFNQIAEVNILQVQKANEIRLEIGNISEVVQSNTATAEQTAASTEVLSNQALMLERSVSKFRV